MVEQREQITGQEKKMWGIYSFFFVFFFSSFGFCSIKILSSQRVQR